jgi:hypothetical protein
MTRKASSCPFLLTALLALLVPLSLLFGGADLARAAQPGEILMNSSGTLAVSASTTIPLYSPGAANFRLEVSGGAANDSIVMTLQDGSGTPPSWAVRSGEVVWGYGNIPGGGRIVLENRSGAPLSFALRAYARGVAPNITEEHAIWSGTVRSGGARSTVQVGVSTAGLYRFTLDAAAGSYQLQVDNNAVLKTVAQGNAPDAGADSVYFLSAGVHTLSLLHNDTEPTINWSVAIAAAGGSAEALPSAESSKVLGGPNHPDEEWIPIQVAAGQPVNVKVEVSGGSADSLVVQLLNGGAPVFTSTNIFGGEISWGTSGLAAGANALRVITAPGNAQPLGYSVTISAIGQTPASWSGTSYGQPAHADDLGRSNIMLTFPTSGLYQFSLGASSGRYQLVLRGGYLQKTVTASDPAQFSAYVPSGTWPLVIAQDPAQPATSWSVAIEPTDQAADSLPYNRSGVTLGGGGNAFGEEWLPLQATGAAPVNLSVVASGGAISDSLVVELYNGETLVYRADRVYSGETFWASADVAAGANRLHIVAAPGNSAPMSYQLGVLGIAEIPTTLQGLSLRGGLSSTLRLNAPVAGTYDLVLTMTEGLGMVLVDPQSGREAGATIAGSTSKLRVPLAAGLHTFVLQQDPSTPHTLWELSASLRRSDVGIALSAVSPSLVPLGQASSVTISGQGFDNETVVELVAADGTVTPLSIVVVSPTEIVAEVPGALATGSFDVRLRSGASGTTTAARALAVGAASAGRTFVPLVLR